MYIICLYYLVNIFMLIYVANKSERIFIYDKNTIKINCILSNTKTGFTHGSNH